MGQAQGGQLDVEEGGRILPTVVQQARRKQHFSSECQAVTPAAHVEERTVPQVSLCPTGQGSGRSHT